MTDKQDKAQGAEVPFLDLPKNLQCINLSHYLENVRFISTVDQQPRAFGHNHIQAIVLAVMKKIHDQPDPDTLPEWLALDSAISRVYHLLMHTERKTKIQQITQLDDFERKQLLAYAIDLVSLVSEITSE